MRSVGVHVAERRERIDGSIDDVRSDRDPRRLHRRACKREARCSAFVGVLRHSRQGRRYRSQEMHPAAIRAARVRPTPLLRVLPAPESCRMTGRMVYRPAADVAAHRDRRCREEVRRRQSPERTMRCFERLRDRRPLQLPADAVQLSVRHGCAGCTAGAYSRDLFVEGDEPERVIDAAVAQLDSGTAKPSDSGDDQITRLVSHTLSIDVRLIYVSSRIAVGEE